ncbi:MAG TPA: PAS domain S-box protein [Verrucomicrobiae bacterium]|nr:PAS domain S-box protein [Verrucomicrobiae bacterium]
MTGRIDSRISWTLVRYALAPGAVALGWLARYAINGVVGPERLPYIFFFPAVAFAAWFGGLGPGLLAALLGSLVADWNYLGEAHRLGLHSAAETASMGGYLLSCAFIIGAIESMHRSQRRLLVEVAQRQSAEAKLKEEKEVLATTLASIGDAVIATDPEGRITFFNAEAERLTGWPARAAAGQPLPTVFRIINEFTRQSVENPVAKVLRSGKVIGLANHTILVAKDGQETPIDDSAAPIGRSDGTLGGVILVFRDFSEKQAALRTSARLAAIVESSGEVIIAKDLNGVVQSWNAAAERLFGYRAQEIIGKPVTVLFPPERLSEEDQILGRLREGKLIERLETVRLAKDGRRIPVAVSVSPVKDKEGRIIGASKIIQDISDLVAAREALVREKELLATTLTSIGDAVVLTDPEGRVNFINAEAERLTGWSKAEASGRPLAEIFRIINEATRQPVEDPVAKVMRLGTVVGLANHTVLIARDGKETAIDDTAAPIRRPGGPLFGIVLVFRDFSEQRRSQQQQQNLYGVVQAVNQARPLPEIYEAALHALTRSVLADRSAILFLDADGVMRFKAWHALSEEYRRQVEGHSPWAPDQFDAQPVCVQQTGQLEPSVREALDREGIRSLAFIPISYEGRLLGKFMIYYNQPHAFTDEELRLAITIASQVALAVQRRRSEEQLERLVRERTAKLQEMMTELQHVSYAITHDMRAPLRAMSTFAGIILEELGSAPGSSPELVDACRRIIASASRLDQLIQDALNYTKAVLQELPLHSVDLARLIPSLLESYPNLQGDKADIHILDPLPTVLGEESLLTQCFSNLLGNAVKFVKPGTRPRINLRVHRLDSLVRISLEDNGIGIPIEAQRRLFGMFERLTTGYEGTGIGLAIVRKVVERMGGRVWVESKPGEGSTFWVELRSASAAHVAR